MRHQGVRVVCQCGHFAIFDPHALWWLCERHGRDNTFRSLRTRFYCRPCQREFRHRVRPIEIAATTKWHTVALPMPDIREWKRALKRVRT